MPWGQGKVVSSQDVIGEGWEGETVILDPGAFCRPDLIPLSCESE